MKWSVKLMISIMGTGVFFLWSLWYYNSQSKINLDQRYFYHVYEGCIQRSQLITDFADFEKYCNWYVEKGISINEGVRLNVVGIVSIDPFEKTYVHNVDTMLNGIVYCRISHFIRKSRRTFDGYVIYDYVQDTAASEQSEFCQDYLDISWSDRFGPGSTPDPRDRL